ncbi:MAG: DUF72 domain-containing protein [Candidatus Eisenbacteria bacterium]|nr:DUF72 domain-containing protein [Candidatus Eisenbacteria bacterium]
MTAPSGPRILLGTQGWSYRDWVGSFYPPGAKQERWLPFYAAVFDTVELDTTFYHPPKPAVVRSWDEHTPAHFRFSAKVPEAITHTARLAGMGEQLKLFVRSLARLGDKLGPLLVQMPAEFERDEGAVGLLERFLAAAPADVRLAVEFRHRSWHVPQTYELLRRHRAAFAWTEWRELPRATEVTADFLYLRWLGDRREIERYDRVQVDRTRSFEAWEADLRRALPDVREVFGYFNNHWAGHSPASANEMKRRLGLATVSPKEHWPQGELW